jgi:hypothetical protein
VINSRSPPPITSIDKHVLSSLEHAQQSINSQIKNSLKVKPLSKENIKQNNKIFVKVSRQGFVGDEGFNLKSSKNSRNDV